MKQKNNSIKTKNKLRKTISNILDPDGNHPWSKPVDAVIIFFIITTLVTIILESVESIAKTHHKLFYTIEAVSMLIFIIEYVLRVWSCVELKEIGKKTTSFRKRLKHIKSPAAIIDLLAILPFLLSFFAFDLRFLRVLRLLRIFKLTRYNSSMNTLLIVLKKESKSFLAVFFVLLVVLIIASSGIYLIEHKHQPEAFGSIPSSMWWAIITLTTVGYGDVAPITTIGKMFGALISLVGIGIVALPAGILASGFSEQMRTKKKSYKALISKALEDGVINKNEYAELRKLRETLDISEDEAKAMIDEQLSTVHSNKISSKCPHCKKSI